ncbi:hypothetical protein KIF59_23180 [Enterobacter cloacae subsp. cloacae]|nr:hypothetical protein [Enterobacter cloacae subsp. cloacae]
MVTAAAFRPRLSASVVPLKEFNQRTAATFGDTLYWCWRLMLERLPRFIPDRKGQVMCARRQ